MILFKFNFLPKITVQKHCCVQLGERKSLKFMLAIYCNLQVEGVHVDIASLKNWSFDDLVEVFK